jgi:Mitochondrial K+-H+ exchange-related
VKVYLLLVNDEEFFFYSDDSETDESSEDDPAASPGIWTGLAERWFRLKKSFREAEAGLARSVRRGWDWLHKRIRPDEMMLARLRSTRRIDLHHPASRPEAEVAGIWQGYLAQRGSRHAVSLTCNAIIAPFALALLWPLPGPNVIGFWFAYRTIHHWLVLRGIRSVRKGWIPTSYHGEVALDLPVDRDEAGKARHGAINGHGNRLDDYFNQPRSRTNARA